MMHDAFTHEVGDDPVPRRRVRISGPVYDDSSVPLLRIEYEDGDTKLMRPSEMRLFLPLSHQRLAPLASPIADKAQDAVRQQPQAKFAQRRMTSNAAHFDGPHRRTIVMLGASVRDIKVQGRFSIRATSRA
jgi:hypothetical protein